jgi:hypothetical protein
VVPDPVRPSDIDRSGIALRESAAIASEGDIRRPTKRLDFAKGVENDHCVPGHEEGGQVTH